jgi:hypothetical protein
MIGSMNTARERLWLVGRLFLTVVLIVAAFAVAIPNCIVPATAASPARFAWGGLLAPVLVSGMLVYCIWRWK